MNKKYCFLPVQKFLSFLGVLLLCACGGGGSSEFPPVVTGFQIQSLQYGRSATFYIGGNDLRSSMSVESNSACTNLVFASSSTTNLLVLNCNIKAVGDIPLTVKTSNGDVVYKTTVTVPKPQVLLTTNLGNVTLELDPVAAPLTVDNFLNYVNTGYYANTLFHRVMPGFVAQAGGFTSGMVKKNGQTAPIALQSNNGLTNRRGSVAMARLGDPNYDSATSEFYINLVDNTSLDFKGSTLPGYAVFGTVVSGMDVVDSMAAKPTGNLNGYANVPVSDVTITAALQIK